MLAQTILIRRTLDILDLLHEHWNFWTVKNEVEVKRMQELQLILHKNRSCTATRFFGATVLNSNVRDILDLFPVLEVLSVIENQRRVQRMRELIWMLQKNRSCTAARFLGPTVLNGNV